jgi:hypothetical protein
LRLGTMGETMDRLPVVANVVMMSVTVWLQPVMLMEK